jgi:hypothetical protein
VSRNTYKLVEKARAPLQLGPFAAMKINNAI